MDISFKKLSVKKVSKTRDTWYVLSSIGGMGCTYRIYSKKKSDDPRLRLLIVAEGPPEAVSDENIARISPGQTKIEPYLNLLKWIVEDIQKDS